MWQDPVQLYFGFGDWEHFPLVFNGNGLLKSKPDLSEDSAKVLGNFGSNLMLVDLHTV